MRVELHPDARAELRSAALWYEEQRDGLGREFTDAVTCTRSDQPLARIISTLARSR